MWLFVLITGKQLNVDLVKISQPISVEKLHAHTQKGVHPWSRDCTIFVFQEVVPKKEVDSAAHTHTHKEKRPPRPDPVLAFGCSSAGLICDLATWLSWGYFSEQGRGVLTVLSNNANTFHCFLRSNTVYVDQCYLSPASHWYVTVDYHTVFTLRLYLLHSQTIYE